MYVNFFHVNTSVEKKIISVEKMKLNFKYAANNWSLCQQMPRAVPCQCHTWQIYIKCKYYEDQGQLECITEKISETLAVRKETKIICILICLIFPSRKHPVAIYIKHGFCTV